MHFLRRSCFSKRLGVVRKFVQFWVAFTPLSHGSNCRFLPRPSLSRQTRWRISSELSHLSHASLLLTVRAFAASLLVIKMYTLDLIRKPTNIPDSILSSASVRHVNGPTLYHTRCPNTRLPVRCPRPHRRSKSTIPSERFSNVVACLVVVFFFVLKFLVCWHVD